MKIAYCVICHKYTPVLRELVDMLGENTIYLHVDAKSDMASFAPIAHRVVFVEERVDVTWGRYSLVEATLKLLRASRGEPCDYIALISGDTLPLRTDEWIKAFLEKNNGREFIYESRALPHRLVARLKYRHLKDNERLRHPLKRILCKMGHPFRFLWPNPYFGALPPLAKWSNWFMISTPLRDWMFEYLDSHPDYIRAFERAFCGDEFFFSTLAKNSPFSAGRCEDSMMYVDWTTGPEHPRALDETDFERLKNSMNKNPNLLFARKFPDGLNLNAYRKYFDLT